MRTMVTVFVRGLEFYGFHGVAEEERVIGHRFRADLEYQVGSVACETDRIDDTVNYGDVALCLVEMGQSRQFKTVERLATVMLDELFARFPGIQSAQLRLAKRLPPAPVIAEEVGIEIRRSR